MIDARLVKRAHKHAAIKYRSSGMGKCTRRLQFNFAQAMPVKIFGTLSNCTFSFIYPETTVGMDFAPVVILKDTSSAMEPVTI